MDTGPLRVAQVLQDKRLIALEMRLLLCAVTGASRVQLVTQSERSLTAAEAERLETLIRRRLAGEPIAYLLGEKEFFGRVFEVSPAVLIPRPETELLIELALQHMPQGARVLDLGTGSGAIAVTLACERPDTTLVACDLSAAALEVATANASRHGVEVRFVLSDWFNALGAARFDLVVSNPPYIAGDDLHLTQGDLRFEPRTALTDDHDGLDPLRKLVSDGPRFLASGAWLLTEHGYDQAEVVRQLMRANSFTEVQSWRDLAGIERITGGRGPIFTDR